jgi:aminoglycoside phosphotransferase (APT) family kinase protein
MSADDARYPEPWRRVLARLGDYTALIVRALNLRPTDVRMLRETGDYLLLGITTPGEQLALKIAPEIDLAREVSFCKAMAAERLPAPRLIQHDLSRTLIPAGYVVETYFGGTNAAAVEDAALLRALARQAGRALRRLHRVPAQGFGQPTATGRWSARSWQGALTLLHAASGAAVYGALLFSAEQWAAVRAATLEHADLMLEQPRMLHGALRPEHVLCTIGEHVQLEALVDPGALVGGDPLYDLACGLLPTLPPAFRSGLLEGYTAVGPLGAADQRRLLRLQLLASFWETCRWYARGEEHAALKAATLALLEAV